MVTPATTPGESGLPAVPSATPAGPVPGDSAPTAEQVQELSQAMIAARTALEGGQYDDALAKLAGVSRLPMLDDHAQRYERLQLLVQYARNFREELSKAVAALRGGDEVPVGTSTVVGVVQTERDRITVRVAGANRVYGIDDLPVGLAIAIADTNLSESDPISLVIKGAHLAARKDARDDQLAKAREWFREAKQKGADIGDLDKVLDDSYQLTP
jgi:hypothetical protein